MKKIAITLAFVAASLTPLHAKMTVPEAIEHLNGNYEPTEKYQQDDLCSRAFLRIIKKKWCPERDLNPHDVAIGGF